MISLTLNTIRAQSPCSDGWVKLLKSLNKTEADDIVVTIEHLLESNGVDDTLWVITRCIPDMEKEKRYMVSDFAESVLYIYEAKYPNDSRVRNCIQAVRDYADGKIGDEKLESFKNAAVNAVNAYYYATNAYYYAARAAAYSAYAASAASVHAAVYAARAVYAADERKKQKAIILKYFGKKPSLVTSINIEFDPTNDVYNDVIAKAKDAITKKWNKVLSNN